MKTYQRTEPCGAYQRVTTVTSNGSYAVSVCWDDGTAWETVKTTLSDMGWHSLGEFLQHRRGFREVRI